MLSSLLSPLRFGVLLALLLVLTWRRLPRGLRYLASLPLIGCVLSSLPVVANLLVGIAESRFPSAQTCAVPLPQTIVVLGGGISRQPVDAADVGALGETSLRRVIGAADLYRAHEPARLVISGGTSQYGVAESSLMAALAQRLGVPAAAITVETESHSTWQNARFVAALEPLIDRRIWLVTSALHMPRSIYAFEQAGFEVCAWPTDSRLGHANSIGYYLPSIGALDKSDAVIHEWLGEAAYRMGWLRSVSRDPWSGGDER